MKKLLFIAVIISLTLFSCASTQKADKSANQKATFGAKAGVNFSDITGPDVDSFTGRTAFHIGGVAEIPVSEVFSVQPELLYSAQGSDYE